MSFSPLPAARPKALLCVAPALPSQPLKGVTLLAVATRPPGHDMLYILCRRAGARLRRAQSLHEAGSHLRLYRPDVVLVDPFLAAAEDAGLTGTALITELAQRRDLPILGLSDHPHGADLAQSAGAHAALPMPLPRLPEFMALILSLLTDSAYAPPTVSPQVLPRTTAAASKRTLLLRHYLKDLARQAQDLGLALALDTMAQSGGDPFALKTLIAQRPARPMPDLPPG